jgi:hypothetical protein
MPPDSRSQNVFGWAKGLVSAFAMTTTPLRLRAINMQAAMGSITACSSFDATGRFLLAANYGMGVAEDEGPGQRPSQPVSSDDWAWSKGHRYGTILVDMETRRVVDLLPDLSASATAAWLP